MEPLQTSFSNVIFFFGSEKKVSKRVGWARNDGLLQNEVSEHWSTVGRRVLPRLNG